MVKNGVRFGTEAAGGQAAGWRGRVGNPGKVLVRDDQDDLVCCLVLDLQRPCGKSNPSCTVLTISVPRAN